MPPTMIVGLRRTPLSSFWLSSEPAEPEVWSDSPFALAHVSYAAKTGFGASFGTVTVSAL